QRLKKVILEISGRDASRLNTDGIKQSELELTMTSAVLTLTSTMANAVPQELFELIIDHFVYRSIENRKTLLSCSLVCRSWVPRSRHHVFKKCRLHPGNVLTFGQLLSSPACTFLPHVHWIFASRNYKKRADRNFDSITDGLRRLTSLEILELSGVIHTGTNFERGFLSAFKGIPELRLVGHLSSTPERIIDLICLFPSLQRLVVSIQTFVLTLSSSVYPLPPPGLHHVAVARNGVKPISAWLLASKHMNKLESFSATSIDPEWYWEHPSSDLPPPLSMVRRALQQAGTSLQHLELNLNANTEPRDPYYDLSIHTSLISLKIICHLQDSPKYLSAVVTSLSSPSLETVSLRFFGSFRASAWCMSLKEILLFSLSFRNRVFLKEILPFSPSFSNRVFLG
ncbi:hypothetical protein B0H13DRAFT_2514526, partial [Mycena leptocephala]